MTEDKEYNPNNVDDLKRFNEFYQKNYKKLLTWSKRHKIEPDTLHDSYLRIVDRISKVGFVGDTFLTYCKLSIRNLHINNCKAENGRYFVDVDDMDWENTIENILLDLDNDNKESLQYQDELMFFSKMLFKFLDSRGYDDDWMFVFKTYYLSTNRFTYKSLNQITGIDKSRCTRIITTMKADIRDNLINYIKENQTND